VPAEELVVVVGDVVVVGWVTTVCGWSLVTLAR